MNRVIPDLARKAAGWMPKWMLAGMYRLGPLSRLMRKVLNRSLPQGASFVEIASGPNKGLELEIDLQSEKDYWLGSYEMDLIKTLEEIIPGKRSAYDVGANIGYISMAMAQLMGPEGRVYAFEALPGNVEKLKRNIAQNSFGRRVFVEEAAISNKSGKAHFQVHSSGFMGKLSDSKGRDADYLEQIEVEALALDDGIANGALPPVEVIKIDIEGGEGLALQGMQMIMREQKPLLLIELHGYEAAKSVFEQLQLANYQVRNLQGSEQVVSSVDELDWKAYVIAEAIE